MELKPGYKQTEVGVIPEDWEVRLLSSTAKRVVRGASPRPIDSPIWFDQQSTIGWVRISDVTRSGRYLHETTQRLSKEGVKHSRYVRSGSLIMSICATVGRPIETQIDTCIHDGFVLFDEPLVDQSFLYHLLIALEPTWSKQGQTGSQMNLNTGIINSCAVPVPPLPEQKAIAQALSDMDALLSGLDDLIAKKRDIKQATMQQLLTGKTRLPGFTGEWEIKRLGDVAILRSGYSFRSEDYSLLGNFKIVTIANVQSGYMTLEGCQSVFGLPTDLQSHQRLNVGDILISMTGNVGRVCRVTEPDCLLNQRVGKISHVGIDEDFLFTLLGQQSFLEEMTKKAKGGAQPNLSNADITEYRIRIPNDCSEQKAIATILSDMDAELEALEQRREKTRELKQAMMQELLTGRTRLV